MNECFDTPQDKARRKAILEALANHCQCIDNPNTEFRQCAMCAAAGLIRDSDGTASAALCEDIAVPQDCQARAEGIAQKDPPMTIDTPHLMNSDTPPRPNYAEFSEALLIAAGLYSDVELAFWLNAPQPLLGMWTPVQLLARGQGADLLRAMRQIEDCVYV